MLSQLTDRELEVLKLCQGLEQCRNSDGAVHIGGDREDPRLPPSEQARSSRPGTSRGACVRSRSGQAERAVTRVGSTGYGRRGAEETGRSLLAGRTGATCTRRLYVTRAMAKCMTIRRRPPGPTGPGGGCKVGEPQEQRDQDGHAENSQRGAELKRAPPATPRWR